MPKTKEEPMKVLFLTNVPSPYLVEFFNLLGQEVDLTVIYERKSASDRHESWSNLEFKHFRALFPFSIHAGSENGFCPTIGFHLKKSYDIIVFGNYASPTGALGVLLLKLQKRKYVLYSEGGLAKEGRSIKEKFKRRVISNAHLYLSGCKPGDEYFIHYGADKKRIKRIPFTTLHRDDVQKIEHYQKDKLALRHAYGIDPEAFIILTVGRFIPLKSIDTLITASSRISHPHQTWIIGDGPLKKDYEKQIADQKSNHIFIFDFMDQTKLRDYYRMSDLFVMPSLTESWGLVIIEAMAQGLPVIASNACVAGLENITNFENGFLFNPKDVDTLTSQINWMIEHPNELEKMRSESIKRVLYHTFENMVDVNLKAFHDFMEDINE